jgi:AraC-like DNA-binding protein
LAIAEDPLLGFYHRSSLSTEREHRVEKQILASSAGKGTVTAYHPETGFCLGCYDVLFHEDMSFSFPPESQGPLYRLVFSFTPSFPGGDFFAPYFLTNNKSSFFSINFSRHAFLPKEKNYRSLEFIFSRDWLIANCKPSSQKILFLINRLTNSQETAQLQDFVDEISFEAAKSIASELQSENVSIIHLKSRIFTFLDTFFQKTLLRANLNDKKRKALQYSVVGEIEKSLSKFPNEELPNIAALAKEFNIGSSTLKRQFKLIYNKSIYNYYLEQKMAIGMTLLEEPNASVSEIAYKLGYQKINSFSKIFKKHYGILPSEVIPNVK